MQKSVAKTNQPLLIYYILLGCSLLWCAMFKHIFENISTQGVPFFKPIFALKPWDQDGRFEYKKNGTNGGYKNLKFCPEFQKWPQKNQTCEKTRPDW